jgi:adenosylmethionine-8-amino-7-oxononanoate aminotransferase
VIVHHVQRRQRGAASHAFQEAVGAFAGGSVALQRAARERGLMIYSCPTPLGRTLVESVLLAPPLVIDEADVDRILERLADAVSTLPAIAIV